MKTYGGLDVFLTSALVGGEWSAASPFRLTPREPPPPYQLERRLGGPQSWFGRHGEEFIQALTGYRTTAPRPFSP
jgi:hypothetical protein